MSVGTLSYDRPANSTVTATTLETDYQISFPSANTVRITQNLTLDPAAVPQVSTVTLSAGSTGDDIAIHLTVSSTTWVYRHVKAAGDTVTTVAAFLATLINTNPNVAATSALGVITITSAIPGQAFTLANTDSTTAGNVVIATTTANSGTALHRKVAEIDVAFTVNTNKFPTVTLGGNWYNGAASPVVVLPVSALVVNGPRSIDTLQTDAGIARV
jgi:hypothetical protein